MFPIRWAFFSSMAYLIEGVWPLWRPFLRLASAPGRSSWIAPPPPSPWCSPRNPSFQFRMARKHESIHPFIHSLFTVVTAPTPALLGGLDVSFAARFFKRMSVLGGQWARPEGTFLGVGGRLFRPRLQSLSHLWPLFFFFFFVWHCLRPEDLFFFFFSFCFFQDHHI